MQNCFVLVSSSCLGHIQNGEKMVTDGVVAQRITSTVAAIRAKAAPGAKIIVTGYPLLFNLPNAKYSTWAGRVNGDTVALNDAIQAAAVASGAVFVDVETAFAGHGIGSSSPWINDFNRLPFHRRVPPERDRVHGLRDRDQKGDRMTLPDSYRSPGRTPRARRPRARVHMTHALFLA